MAQSAEGDLTKLTEVGVALSAERDLDKLLERVLEAAQDIACCNAASIYLLDDSADPNELVFKLTRNDSIELEFTENRFPVSKTSISGARSIGVGFVAWRSVNLFVYAYRRDRKLPTSISLLLWVERPLFRTSH